MMVDNHGLKNVVFIFTEFWIFGEEHIAVILQIVYTATRVNTLNIFRKIPML